MTVHSLQFQSYLWGVGGWGGHTNVVHFTCVVQSIVLSFLLTPWIYLFQVNSLPADKLQEIQKAIELFSVGQGPAKTMEEASRRSYQFWDTQPVPKLGEILQTPPDGECLICLFEKVFFYFHS